MLLHCADLSRPPIDLSLKTRAMFSSQQPFDICRDAISLPSSEGMHTQGFLRILHMVCPAKHIGLKEAFGSSSGWLEPP